MAGSRRREKSREGSRILRGCVRLGSFGDAGSDFLVFSLKGAEESGGRLKRFTFTGGRAGEESAGAGVSGAGGAGEEPAGTGVSGAGEAGAGVSGEGSSGAGVSRALEARAGGSGVGGAGTGVSGDLEAGAGETGGGSSGGVPGCGGLEWMSCSGGGGTWGGVSRVRAQDISRRRAAAHVSRCSAGPPGGRTGFRMSAVFTAGLPIGVRRR